MYVIEIDKAHFECVMCLKRFASEQPLRGGIGTLPPDHNYLEGTRPQWIQGWLCDECAAAPIPEPHPAGTAPPEEMRRERAWFPGGRFLTMLGDALHADLQQTTWRSYQSGDWTPFFWHLYDAERKRVYLFRIMRGWLIGDAKRDADSEDAALTLLPAMQADMLREGFNDEDA